MPQRFIAVIASLLAPFVVSAQSSWFAFSPSGPVNAGSAVDASNLLVDYPGEDVTGVIDARGHLYVGSDGHFYFTGTNARAKFFGLNFMVNTIFPPFSGAPQQPGEYVDIVPPDAADQLAVRLSRMGVNVVRLHFIDGQFGRPVSIWNPAYPNDTQHLDPLQVARLDYMIYTLKQHGIYCDINLHAGRVFGPGDGVTDSSLFAPDSYNKPATEFDPVMIQLQQQYAEALLNHVNPYTNLRIADDPAVAFVEISNEDTLLYAYANNQISTVANAGACLQGAACGLPLSYSQELDAQWTTWLRNKYGSDFALAAAWAPPAGGFSQSGGAIALSNNGFTNWVLRTFNGAAGSVSAGADATAPYGYSVAVKTQNTGNLFYGVQLDHAGLSLQNGQLYDLTVSLKWSTNSPVEVDLIQDQSPFAFYQAAATFNATPAWQTLTATFQANITNAGHVQMNFDLGENVGTVWISQISLTPHPQTGVASGESLAAGTVQRETATGVDSYTLARSQDLTQFYYDTQQSFFGGMNSYLRNTVGVKSLMTGSAVFGLPLNADLASQQDFIDEHIYNDYPLLNSAANAFSTWSIQNQPFTSSPLFPLFSWAALAAQGKPFTVTESDEPFPNDYASEWLPWLTTFANFQDWDALMPHLYGNWPDDYFAATPPGWQGNFFFAVSGNPIAAAQTPVAARVFLESQNTPAAERVDLNANRTDLLQTPSGTVTGNFYGYRGYADWQGLVHSVRSNVSDQPSSRTTYAGDAPSVITSDHGELTYNQTNPQAPIYTVNSPYLQAATGFIAGQTFNMPHLSATISASTAAFGSITLQPVDNQPLLASKRLLLSVMTRYENTGEVWNAGRTSLGQSFGTAPSLIEPLAATYTVYLRPDSVFGVYALDAQGNRIKELASGTGSVSFASNTGVDGTVWYEIVATSTARPTPVAKELYYLIADHSGRCLDVRGGSTQNGAPLQQWTCWGGESQLWRLMPGPNGTYEIASAGSGKAVDITNMSTSPGTPMQQWTFWGGASQLWKLVPTGDGFEVVSDSDSQCLDVTGGPAATANGVGVQQWGCVAGTNQVWQVLPAANEEAKVTTRPRQTEPKSRPAIQTTERLQKPLYLPGGRIPEALK